MTDRLGSQKLFRWVSFAFVMQTVMEEAIENQEQGELMSTKTKMTRVVKSGIDQVEKTGLVWQE